MHTVSYGQLPNGLRVVTVHRPHLHRAVVTAYIHVGSRHETRRTNGLTHFLEHMLFRGTARHPSAAAFNHQVESMGGSLNAATHGDFTLFELTLPPDALADGCVELGEVFARPVFSDIDVERGIVREEILEDLDEDGEDVNADNLVRAQLFGAHPLGYPITGTVKNVERFTVRDLRRHLAAHFTAGNMVVAVAGPLAHKAMMRAVARGFGAVPVGAPTQTKAFAARQSRASIRAVPYSGSSQTAVRVAFPTAGLRVRASRAIELLIRVLDDGMSTRLHRRICDERGLAYEVGAGVELFEDVGVLDVSASVAHGSLGELLREVLSILGDLAIEGPTRAEVEKAHRRYAFDLDALEDDAHALCDFYGSAELVGMRESPAARRREMLALTASDLRRAARTAFAPSRLNLALVGAVDARARAEITAELRRFRARIAAGARKSVTPARRFEAPVRATVRRTVARAFSA